MKTKANKITLPAFIYFAKMMMVTFTFSFGLVFFFYPDQTNYVILRYIAPFILYVSGEGFDSFLYGAVVFLLVCIAIVHWPKVSASKIKPTHLLTQTKKVEKALSHEEDGVWAGKIGRKDIYASMEDRAVVIGPPGTGKTAFLVAQILKWAETGRSFVAIDVKPELYGITRRKLRQLGYRTLVYNPTARKGDRYNMLSDIDTPEAVGELAASLIPSDEAQNAVFNENARDLLDALISHARVVYDEASLVSIREILSQHDDPRMLLRLLASSQDPDVVDIAHALGMSAQNERLMGSIAATLRSRLRFLRYPNVRASLETSDFSLADLTRKQPVALFLQFDESHRETTAHLLATMIAHLMRYLIIHTERPPVALFLDEIGTMPVIPELAGKLNTIRSRNLPTWMYWQSMAQMNGYSSHRGEGTSLILGACDFQMMFRQNDPVTAEWMSQRIGVTNVTLQSSSVRDLDVTSKSTSASMGVESLLHPHELHQLESGEVVCAYRDHTWRGQAPAYFDLWPEYKGKKLRVGERYSHPYPTSASAKEDETIETVLPMRKRESVISK